MVNNSKLKLIYLMILFGLSIAQPFLYDASPTESKILANTTNQISDDHEKNGKSQKTAISKDQNCKKILLG